MDIKKRFLESIASGLKRKTVTSCSRWAELYRVMGGGSFPGPWRFKHYPWLKDMHDSEAEMNIGQKSAQMGFTEALLNIVFYNIDVKSIDSLYVLPAKTPDASDFSAARFDPALELSPHLQSLFSDVQNVGHKRAGSTNLYIRGSRSRSGLKSVPVGLIALDEVDEMTQENIPLALERTAGQLSKLSWMISTPTLEGVGINRYYQSSSQNHYFFKCPACNRYIELTFPDSLVITGETFDDPRVKETHLICTQCKATLNHENKFEWLSTAKWIEGKTDRDSKGWHISQLYSPTVKPFSIALSYFRSLTDRNEEQELYNSKLGLPHEVDGARITDEMINRALGEYRKGPIVNNQVITMGIDVGHPWIHYEIDAWTLPEGYINSTDLNILSKPRVIDYGKIMNFEALDILMNLFGVHFAVIDSHPERRKAFEFASRFWGRVKLCFYSVGITGKQMHVSEAESTVSVDRTSWLDLSLGRFHSGSIKIPGETDLEYRSHLKALVRTYKADKNGNQVGTYVNGSDADHYAHARNYAEIALPLAVSLSSSQTLSEIF